MRHTLEHFIGHLWLSHGGNDHWVLLSRHFPNTRTLQSLPPCLTWLKTHVRSASLYYPEDSIRQWPQPSCLNSWYCTKKYAPPTYLSTKLKNTIIQLLTLCPTEKPTLGCNGAPMADPRWGKFTQSFYWEISQITLTLQSRPLCLTWIINPSDVWVSIRHKIQWGNQNISHAEATNMSRCWLSYPHYVTVCLANKVWPTILSLLRIFKTS
jgi:hypothetical protein